MVICTTRDRPQRRNCSLISFPLKSIATATALVMSSGTFAAEWTVVPGVEASETYTDNVNLAPKSLAETDYVSEITPSVAIMKNGEYLKVNANYSMQEIDYAEKSAPATFTNQLIAALNAKFIENLLFLDSTASISQQNISALGPQPANNIFVTDNRTNVRTYAISPYLSHTFDTFAVSELRYSYSSASADTGGLSTTHSDMASFNVNSGPAFRILGWGMQYVDQIIHYPGADNVDLRTMSGNLSYLVAPDLHLTATAGYDHNDYSTLGGLLKGYFWTTGFDWTVSDHTSLAATVGHRYYGNTDSLNAVARSRTTLWNLGYNESVTTTQSQFGLPASNDISSYLNQLFSGTISDPTQRALQVNNFIQQNGLPNSLSNSVNYFSNSVFLQKQLQGSVIITGQRTTLILGIFDTLQIPLSTQEDVNILFGNDKTRQVGASAVLSRRLSAQTSATVTLLATRAGITVPNGAVVAQNNQTLKFGLTRELTSKLHGSVEIRRDREESSQPGVEYTENAIVASLNLQL